MTRMWKGALFAPPFHVMHALASQRAVAFGRCPRRKLALKGPLEFPIEMSPAYPDTFTSCAFVSPDSASRRLALATAEASTDTTLPVRIRTNFVAFMASLSSRGTVPPPWQGVDSSRVPADRR